MVSIKLCQSDEEILLLAETAKIIWYEYFQTIISTAQIDYMVQKYQSYEALRHAIHEEGYLYHLVYHNQVLVGYCGIKVNEHRLFLSKLYIRKEYRGCGISSIVFQHVQAYAFKQKLTAIYLTCNKYNTHSLNIYKHFGFVITERVQTDIGQGFIMDDYILELPLGNA